MIRLPAEIVTHTVHHPHLLHPQPRFSGDNVVVITTPERRRVLKERTVGTSLIGIRNATLMANSSPDFLLVRRSI